jgi:hypothetical protein
MEQLSHLQQARRLKRLTSAHWLESRTGILLHTQLQQLPLDFQKLIRFLAARVQSLKPEISRLLAQVTV